MIIFSVKNIKIISLLFVLYSASVVTWAAEQVVIKMNTTLPPPIGYRIGDILQLNIELHLGSSDWTIDAESLPVTKRLNRWLELQEIEVDKQFSWNNPFYRINVRYQIIGNPDKLSALIVPAFYFELISKDDNWPVVIEPWSYVLSPVLLHEDRLAGAEPDLQPAATPVLVPLWNRGLRMFFAGLVALLCIIYLLYQTFFVRYLKGRNLPFAKASKKIGLLCHTSRSNEVYREALQYFHQAVEKSHGSPVFHKDLDSFFHLCPQFQPQTEAITRVYLASNAEFFNLGDKGQNVLSLKNDLLPLCKVCHRLELNH